MLSEWRFLRLTTVDLSIVKASAPFLVISPEVIAWRYCYIQAFLMCGFDNLFIITKETIYISFWIKFSWLALFMDLGYIIAIWTMKHVNVDIIKNK